LTPRQQCDDGDACTTADACAAGVCTGLSTDCSAMGDACNSGVCDGTTGTCTTAPVADATTCDDGNSCTTSDVCTAGVCAGTDSGLCTGLMPGRTDLTASAGGWTVRCLSWSARVCTHMQMMMDCSVCVTYPSCGVWHDVTNFNDGELRTSLNWCAIATGTSTVALETTGVGSAVAPRGCGWNSSTHPLCESGRASYQSGVPGITPTGGLLLDEGYCSSGALLAVDCAAW